jgi:hypothetical protein
MQHLYDVSSPDSLKNLREEKSRYLSCLANVWEISNFLS